MQEGVEMGGGGGWVEAWVSLWVTLSNKGVSVIIYDDTDTMSKNIDIAALHFFNTDIVLYRNF